MTPDFKTQLDSIDGQEPSLHKVDKKLSILIFQVLDVLEKHNDLKKRMECVEDKQDKSEGFFKGVSAAFGVIITVITAWVALKK